MAPATPRVKCMKDADPGRPTLRRALGPLHLTMRGIGSVIGTGIFVLTGTAASPHAGPALVLSMIVAAIACALAGFCDAELASMMPVAGSAYTCGYASSGQGPRTRERRRRLRDQTVRAPRAARPGLGAASPRAAGPPGSPGGGGCAPPLRRRLGRSLHPGRPPRRAPGCRSGPRSSTFWTRSFAGRGVATRVELLRESLGLS